MKHFIVTRFNLKVEDWKKAKDGSQVLTDNWLNNRFHLFEKYCLPSVINQSNNNFYWLIFLDKDTPLKYRDRINQLTHSYSNYFPLYIDGITALNNSFKEFIKQQLENQDDFIITTRMDNDDAIHEQFIESIQKLFVAKHNTVIDLRKGYQMNISNGFYECRNYYNTFNPFISLIESSDSFETVFSMMHKEWKNGHSQLLVYEKEPLWIEIIHKKNKLNQTRNSLPLIKRIDLEKFGIKKELPFRKSIYIFKNNWILKFKRVYGKYLKNL